MTPSGHVDVGNYSLSVQYGDGNLASNRLLFYVLVYNNAPRFTSLIASVTVQVGAS